MGESGGWQTTQEKFRIMPHPDAVTALQQGEVQGHMATPLFLQQNLADGAPSRVAVPVIACPTWTESIQKQTFNVI
jgi:hypothetical protein